MTESIRHAQSDVADRLHREMRVRFGPVAPRIVDPVLNEDGFVLSADEFFFATDGGVRFHYGRGEGIVAELPGPHAEDEFRLYLWGTVFGAVAWLNGFFPLHASAVVTDGRVYAFTADSGGGKSTLAAALATRGFAHLCDDTLPVFLAPGGPVAIPDRKPLKLWDDAFSLVPAIRTGAIAAMPGKSYARVSEQCREPVPLNALIVLERGEQIRLEPVLGAGKLTVLVDAMYRDFIPAALGGKTKHRHDLIALANSIEVWRLTRPFSGNPAGFAKIVADIADLPAFHGR